MSVRVLCVAGSPRRTGNSTAMLDACIRGIESAGGIADRLALAEFHVHGCIGCGQCSSMGQCVVNDDMHEIYPRIDAADVIVIASPVYFAGVPATLKAFYDRCQPYWARRYILRVPPRESRRPGALMLVRGGGDPYGSECAVTTTRSVFAVLETELNELMDIEGPDLPGEISSHQGALADAEALGRRLVSPA